jgi:hypothetical protein
MATIILITGIIIAEAIRENALEGQHIILIFLLIALVYDILTLISRLDKD